MRGARIMVAGGGGGVKRKGNCPDRIARTFILFVLVTLYTFRSIGPVGGHMRTIVMITVAGLLLAFGSQPALAHPFKCTSAITSNFNGTAIAAGDFVWFNGVVKVSGLSKSPTTIFVTHATITFTANGKTYLLPVPDSEITWSTSTTTATTDVEILSKEIGSPLGWDTDVQFSGLAGNDFLAGFTFPVPSSGLPGGIKNVIWQATFSSNAQNLTVSWKWGAAVYTNFSPDYNALGVKPVDDNKASQYQNSDHAGTPENFKTFVIGGARGGGGSNFTGSYSGTGSCALMRVATTSITASQP
jgi:hypothetical protein